MATYGFLPEIGRPRLSYSLEQVRIGNQIVDRFEDRTPAARVEEREIYYERGVVEERYVLLRDSLEQIFVVRELPADRGAITVTGRIETNLTPPPDGTIGSKLAFSHDGRERLSISDAVAVDAAGRRTGLELAYAEGRISLTVPSHWVADAVLPIVVDPLIGGPISVDSSAAGTAGTLPAPRVAYNSVNNEWLVVWHEYLATENIGQAILGARVSASGALIQTFPISGLQEPNWFPTVSYAPSVNRYLVAWGQFKFSGDPYDVQRIAGRILDGSGAFLTSEFVIEDTTGFDGNPSAAFDGTNWYVAFDSSTPQGDGTDQYNVLGRFVSTAGVPGIRADPDVDLDYAQFSSVAYANGVYLVLWKKGVSSTGLYARILNPSGSFLSPITEIESHGP